MTAAQTSPGFDVPSGLVVFVQRRGQRNGEDIGELMLVDGTEETLRRPERTWKVIQRCGHRHVEMSARYVRCGEALQRKKRELKAGAARLAKQVAIKKGMH